MAIPKNKPELLAAIEVNFEKLMADLRTVPEERACEIGMEGHAKGTEMSVSNLVSYLIGWNELVLKWLEKDAAGEAIDFPETGFKWNELGRLAKKFYCDYAALSYGEQLARLQDAKERIVLEIERRSNAEIYERAWYEKWTMGRMIQFNTSSPYANARTRLHKWKKAQSV